MEIDDRKRVPPADRFAGEEHAFNLAQMATDLREDGTEPRDGHRQIALFHENGLNLVLFDFEADGRLSEHAADGVVLIQAVTGAFDVTTPVRAYALPAGSLLVLEAGIRHDVVARFPGQLLLTVHLPHG